MVHGAQPRESSGDVDPVSDRIRALTGVSRSRSSFGKAHRDGVLLTFAAAGVLEGLACHAEQPGTRLRQVNGHVIQAAPRHEHYVAHDVLSVRWIDPPPHEAEQFDVTGVEQRPEALFAML